MKGAAASSNPGLAVGAIEHPCILKPAAQLAGQGWQVQNLAVDGAGRLDFSALRRDLAAQATFVVGHDGNNETGVIQDIAALASAAKAAGGWFHTDAVQALGKLAD
jgi:cysteine desulfurase